MADKPRNTNSEASSRSPSNSNAAGEKIREKLRKKLFDSLQNYKTEEERIQFLVQRILDLEASNTDLRKECEQIKRQNGQISMFEKKVNSLEKQLSKTEMAKSKLEELCRELNKSNKDEKEQNQLRLKALQTVHNDTVNNLKKSLSEIQQSVGAKNEHDKKVAEVEKLSFNLNQLATDYDKRLKDLKKLYDEREDDMKTITREKEDEMTKLRAQIDGMNKRVSGVFDENVHLKQQILTSEQKAQKSIESELGLRKMLDDYSSKYAKLLNSLTQSNKSFDRVKEDMGKVESDARKYQARADDFEKTIKLLTSEKFEFQKELAHKDRQLAQLQELCRRLRSGEKCSNSCENHSPANSNPNIEQNFAIDIELDNMASK